MAKKKIVKCGFVINPSFPWLGCSPDGLVVEDGSITGCIEVKCPFSKRDQTLKKATDSDKSFFLKVYEDGLKLKQNHAYYYQCQGVINILEVPWIDFIVHTEKDIHVERIYRDKILWENHIITGLTDFYIKYILPKLNT